MPPRPTPPRYDAPRKPVFWNDASRCQNTLEFPFVSVVRGGLQGGREREARRAILTSFSWDPGLWPDGGPPEPQEFWVHWDSDQAVAHAIAWNQAVRTASDCFNPYVGEYTDLTGV